MEGGDCIDLVHLVGHCTLTFQISGGTGRFQGAAGVLTYTETAQPVLADALNNPVFFAETGEFTGTISGVGTDIERPDETSTFVFPQGTVNLDHPQTDGSDDFNEVACIDRFTFSGTYDITSGTGAYAQATGEGTYTGRGIFIGRRTAEGCSEEGGTSFFFVTAEGTTTLP